MNIVEVIPREDYMLYVRAADGRAGLLDVSPFLDSEAFEPLRNREEFERLHNGHYFIEWECGADLSADTIEARWRLLADDIAQQGA
jgi:hypothetical protein